nr:7-deoxyloganetin glucosyltransferase-like [Tanacetum cinerariifolium]
MWYLFDLTSSSWCKTDAHSMEFGGKLRDRNAKESWALLEDLALYDNKIWNDPRDFAKSVKSISLPQDVPCTSDHRLIELKHQVQRLMEAYIAPIQPTQVNKITSSCEICSGPHDTQHCMENPTQDFVDYASSCIEEAGGLVSNFMASQDARLSKFETDFKQQQSKKTNKIDTVLKAIIDRMAGALPSDTVKNPKLNVNSTSPVLSACSYPIEDPQCSSHPYNSIGTKDPETPLLVGRGFLAIANAVIDCRKAKIAIGEGIIRFLALGRHLEEIHLNWAHLEKKRKRLRTYTKSLKELCKQCVETAAQTSSDVVAIFLETVLGIDAGVRTNLTTTAAVTPAISTTTATSHPPHHLHATMAATTSTSSPRHYIRCHHHHHVITTILIPATAPRQPQGAFWLAVKYPRGVFGVAAAQGEPTKGAFGLAGNHKGCVWVSRKALKVRLVVQERTKGSLLSPTVQLTVSAVVPLETDGKSVLREACKHTNCWHSFNKWGIGMAINSNVDRREVENLVRILMVEEIGKHMRETAIVWKKRVESMTSMLNIDNLINKVLLQ